MTPVAVDRAWLAAHPLPEHGPGTTKNSRGRVLAVGGGAFVPGALRLTGEAALRAGCGKLRMATAAPVAATLGTLLPEAATVALPVDDAGEIAAQAAEPLLPLLDQTDALVLGPGMTGHEGPLRLVQALLAESKDGLATVLDAACLSCCTGLAPTLAGHQGRLVLTPHHGEAARLMDLDEGRIAEDPERIATEIAARFHAIVVLKSSETLVASPNGALLLYRGGGVGLATGGSGDVLAGIIGGLLSRGAEPLVAAAWGVWLHGEAGSRAAKRIGPIGFLARELLPEIPGLMASGAPLGA